MERLARIEVTDVILNGLPVCIVKSFKDFSVLMLFIWLVVEFFVVIYLR